MLLPWNPEFRFPDGVPDLDAYPDLEREGVIEWPGLLFNLPPPLLGLCDLDMAGESVGDSSLDLLALAGFGALMLMFLTALASLAGFSFRVITLRAIMMRWRRPVK